MNEANQIDVIDVRRGDGRRRDGVGAGISMPAAAAGSPLMRSRKRKGVRVANGGPEGRRGEEVGPKKTVVRAKPSVVGQIESSQQTALTFEAASTAERKRKAEERVDDKLPAMATTITELMGVQKHMAESQNLFLESNKALMDSDKTIMEIIKGASRGDQCNRVVASGGTLTKG